MKSLRLYTLAVKLHQVGRNKEAAAALSQAIGSVRTLPKVADSVDKLLSPASRAMDVTSVLMKDSLKKGR